MARLSELVKTTSRVLNFEERSVILCARYLREAGLILQGGRGPSAAQMRPRDATNLLLGVMASDTIKDAPKSVRQAREAELVYLEGRPIVRPWAGDSWSRDAQRNIKLGGRYFDDVASYQFLKYNSGPRSLGPRSLGAALDALFDEVVRDGGLKNDAGQFIVDFELFVRRHELSVDVKVGDSDQAYYAYYKQLDPGLVAQRVGMRTMTEVGLKTIYSIADTLRGYQPKQGEVARPPYPEGEPQPDA